MQSTTLQQPDFVTGNTTFNTTASKALVIAYWIFTAIF